jgi:type VI secretion system protein VasG
MLKPALLQVFPAALLGRMITIPYFPLSDKMLSTITSLQLDRIKRRVEDNLGIVFSYDEQVISLVTGRCTDLESGGRMIDAILTNSLLPQISNKFLNHLLGNKKITKIRISVQDNDFSYQIDC